MIAPEYETCPPLEVAVYVGSFDPFHDGHLEVAQACLNHAREVLVVLNPVCSHKDTQAGREHRLEMIRRRLYGQGGIRLAEGNLATILEACVAADHKLKLLLETAIFYGVPPLSVADVAGSDSFCRYPDSYFIGHTILLMQRDEASESTHHSNEIEGCVVRIGLQRCRISSTAVRTHLRAATCSAEVERLGISKSQFLYIREHQLYGICQDQVISDWDRNADEEHDLAPLEVFAPGEEWEVGVDIGGSATKVGWRPRGQSNWSGFQRVEGAEHAAIYCDPARFGENLIHAVETITGIASRQIQRLGISVTGRVNHDQQLLELSDRLNEFAAERGGYTANFDIPGTCQKALSGASENQIWIVNDGVAAALGAVARVTEFPVLVLTMGTFPAAAIVNRNVTAGTEVVFDCESWLDCCSIQTLDENMPLARALNSHGLAGSVDPSQRVGQAIAALMMKIRSCQLAWLPQTVVLAGGHAAGIETERVVESMCLHLPDMAPETLRLILPENYDDQAKSHLQGVFRFGDLHRSRVRIQRMSDTGFALTNLDPVTIVNSDKDGSMVAARLSSALNRSAFTRSRYILFNECKAADVIEDHAWRTVAHYMRHGQMGHNPLLSGRTLVFGSVHRLALYLAEVLHAPVLPMQFLDFSHNSNQLGQSPHIQIIGCDHDRTDAYWIWNKISDPAYFPTAYLNLIRDAETLVVVRSTDTEEEQCGILGRVGQRGYVNGTLKAKLAAPHLWRDIESRIHPVSVGQNLRQWEWGLPDASIDCLRQVWSDQGKAPSNFHVVGGSTISLFQAILPLWECYLADNGIDPRGFTMNSYWCAFPGYERVAGLLPIHYYKFDTIRKFAAKFVARYKPGSERPISRETWCAFANDIGSDTDLKDIRAWLQELGVLDACWLSYGFNLADGNCWDCFGVEIPPPAEMIRSWYPSAPFLSHEFHPLPVDLALRIVHDCLSSATIEESDLRLD